MKKKKQAKALKISEEAWKVCSSMEKLARKMAGFKDDEEIQTHGQELLGAAHTLKTWAKGIEADYD